MHPSVRLYMIAMEGDTFKISCVHRLLLGDILDNGAIVGLMNLVIKTTFQLPFLDSDSEPDSDASRDDESIKSDLEPIICFYYSFYRIFHTNADTSMVNIPFSSHESLL